MHIYITDHSQMHFYAWLLWAKSRNQAFINNPLPESLVFTSARILFLNFYYF